MPKKWMVGLLAAMAAGAVGASALSVAHGPGSTPGEGGGPAGSMLVGNAQSSDDSPGIFGLTRDGSLVAFRATDPDDARRIGMVKGLVGDTSLVGIDFRVQDGNLYGVGDQGGVYTLRTSNARATKVSQLTVALSGQLFGVDFNPAANRLRVVSDTGQNLRHNIDDPAGAPLAGMTATDTALTMPPAIGTTQGVTAAAYTNNDLDSTTATTLFDTNVMTDQLAVQSPANQGELAPTGGLQVDATGDAGMDILSETRDGRTVGNTGYAVLSINGRAGFYRVNLLTGKASLVDWFSSKAAVTDIAVALDR